MPILIDGHNLIGAGVFPDIRLSDEDDEAKLVARLRVWKSRYKGGFTVIFDRGIPGGKDRKLGGAGVEVIFAASPRQADDLIRKRIRGRTPGLILVSNDRALRQEAQAQGVTVWSGQEFAQRMTLSGPDAPEPGADPDVRLSGDEVEGWLDLFQRRSRDGEDLG